MSDYAIELEKGKLPLFGSIYSLGPVELEVLKTYIKTNLANDFIRLFKSLTRAPILFNRKLDESLCLYVNYQIVNNIIIKSRYPLSLIDKLLDWLSQAKRFIQ